MANVKMSPIGLMDMLYFKNKKVQRDKIIERTPIAPLAQTYASNENAAARHPLSQFFTIEDIRVRGKGDVRTYTLRRSDGENPAFFRAGQFVVIRQMIDGKLIARPVTLSCGPALTLEGRIQLTVKRVEQDAFLSAYIHENWKVGDQVETSGAGGEWPAGFLMGTVESVSLSSDGLGAEAVIVPVCDLTQLDRVYIMRGFSVGER